MNEPEFIEYQEKVLEYLEYLEYPEYVCMFEPEGVARSVSLSTAAFYIMGQSYRMAAIAIFGLTWDKIKTGQNIHNIHKAVH